MMKYPLWFLGLLIVLLSACDNLNTDSDPLPTAIPITNTPSIVPPTPTAVVANTLPPVQDLSIPSLTPAPTRTLAATLTPAPTRTPDQINNVQLPDVTPAVEDEPEVVENPFGEVESGPILQIRYGEITTRLSEIEIPLSTETLADDTLELAYSDTGPILRFGIVQDIEEPPLDIIAQVIFSFDPQEGLLRVSLETAFEAANPANAYDGTLLLLLEDELQKALNTVVVNSFEREVGEGIPFVVTGFAESATSLSVETGVTGQ